MPNEDLGFSLNEGQPEREQKDKYGINNGCILYAKNDIPFLEMEKGDVLHVENDGKYLRNGNLTWNLEKLTKEIDDGVWNFTRES